MHMKHKSDHINSSLLAPGLTASLKHGYLDELFKVQEQLALAEGSLYEFFKLSWPYIEGNMPYVDSWHIRAIAEHLEAVYARQIKKLIINVPPRTGKTNLISVAFPAWVWIHNPSERCRM